jgi:glycosyltransferase involved in cell wall biosynthesis
MQGPEISVIVRTKNRPLFLPRALSSILNQSFGNWEILLINDGGERDAVNAVVHAFGGVFENRLKVEHVSDGIGMEGASNLGLKLSRGKFVAVHDDDDSWEREFLSKVHSKLTTNNPLGAKGACAHVTRIVESVIDDKITVLRREDYNSWLRYVSLSRMMGQITLPPISFVFSRELALEIGSFNSNLPVLGDWDFLIRFLMHSEILVVQEPLANYHHRLRENDAKYGGTITHQKETHLLYDQYLRNDYLRKAQLANPSVLGLLANQNVDFAFLAGMAEYQSKQLIPSLVARIDGLEKKIDHLTRLLTKSE